MAREECKALLDALNKATACYHHLALAVGGSGDSQNLRVELRHMRQKALGLAVTARAGLTAALRDRSLGTEERSEFERLWVAFAGCLDLLEADLQRSLDLSAAFPLQAPQRPLVRTGLAARSCSTRSLRHQADGDLDAADPSGLECELLQVRELIHDMEMKVNVPRWTVQPRQAAAAELLPSLGASSGGGVSVEERTGPCDPNKALAATVFSAVLLATVALAVCVAKLS
ncbi:regulator of G-protein signaling 9-binding protein [Echinops telfairi]|uniref:Regulator of G-protein signaling 9-binding protein n=1 Tax=Echinops telfairi TaxID=9371 RepID=A0ABM0IPI5_ECHTE|nr:regulator of G-protein signaling 9-binding protein [Echinops telfairi]